MTNKIFLHWCSMLFTSMLLACTIQSTSAQELLVEWQRSRYYERITVPKHMTVVPETGERFVIGEEGDRKSLIKYDASGNVMWRIPLSSIYAHTAGIAYNAGAVYVLVTDIPAIKVLKFDDLGTRSSLAWEWEYIASGGSTDARAIIKDPIGDGVVITSESRYDSPPTRGMYRTMHTFRISADRIEDPFDDFDLGLYAAGAELSPRAMCADDAGSIYITGMSDGIRRPERPYDGTDGYVSPSRLFAVKYDTKGTQDWTYKTPESGDAQYGYDIEIDNAGVYVLGQSTPAHYNIPEPLRAGHTTLTKLNIASGDLIRTLSNPSRIREWPLYPINNREALVVTPGDGGVFITYDAVATSSTRLERYNASLDLQWSRDLSMGAETHFNALIMMSSGRLALSMNNLATEATRSVIGTYTTDNRLVSRITLSGIALMQILPDGNNKIHVAGLSTIFTTTRMAYEAKIGYSPYYSILPMELSVTEHLNLHFDRNAGLYWDVIKMSWSCPSLPCAPEFMASVSDQNGGWKEIITKPGTFTLPQSQDFTPFTLAVKTQANYQPLYQIDGTLPESGINALELNSNWEEKTLRVSVKTDGAFVPVTLSLFSITGKALGDRKMIAPGEQLFFERFKEPVAYIRFSAPAKASLLSFFPNPSSGQFKVSLDKSIKLPALFTVHNGVGTKVHQQLLFSATTEVTLSPQSPGLFVARVTSNQGVIAKTLQIK